MSVYSRPLVLPSEASQVGPGRTTARVKDVLLEHLARDIKQLQALQSDMETAVDMVTASDRHAQILCEHLDHILMHGLREYEQGYWPFVSYFTRSEATRTIQNLSQVTTSVGRGRAWLYMALNEQAMESYVRMFLENQAIVQEHYLRESFLRDFERLLLLVTLMAGLDFVSFDLNLDCSYLDYGASEVSSQLGVAWNAELTPDVEPSFISAVTPQRKRLEGGSLSLPRRSDPAHPPASKERLTSSYAEPSHRVAVERPRIILEDHTPPDEGHTSIMSQEGARQEEMREPSRSKQKPVDAPRPPPVDQVDSFSGSRNDLDSKRSLTRHLSHGPETGVGPELVVHMGSRKKRSKKKKRRKGEEARVKVASEWRSGEAELRADDGEDEEAASGQQQEENAQMGAEEGSSAVSTPVGSMTESIDRLAVSSGVDTTGRGSRDEMSLQHSSFVSQMTPPFAASDRGSVPDGTSEATAEPTGTHVQLRADLADDQLDTAASTGGCEPPCLQEERAEGTARTQQDHRKTGEGSSNRSPEGRPLPHTDHSKASEPAEGKPRPGDLHEDMNSVVPGPPGEGQLLAVGSGAFKGPPKRPAHITEADRTAADIKLDDNTRLVFQLDILTSEEKTERLVQVNTPSGFGQYRNAFVLVTSQTVYLLRKDGTEGLYSKELGIKYSDLDHIVIGLGWQSLILVYGLPEGVGTGKCVLLTGSEAVSKSLVDTMRLAASRCPGFCRSLPLNRDDDARVEAIERELIKLGSQTSMDIVQYCLVNWEELGPPQVGQSAGRLASGGAARIPSEMKSATLLYKTSNMLGLSVWKQGYFELREGCLYQYNSEEDKVVRSSYPLWGCAGCTRTAGENKPFVLSVLGDDGPVLVLAAASEEELTGWTQALCEAVTQESTHLPSTKRTCLSCAVLLTQNKIHVLQEDWSNESVQLVGSCEVTDVNDISVDSSLPLYCTISYDCGDSQRLWLLCFTSEYELGKFESALAVRWKELFQIDVQFSEVSLPEVRGRAHRAVELMQGSRFRSDSVTRGRTEFSYTV